MTLPRGFKTMAENDALAHRRALGLQDTAPLDPVALAGHLDITVVSADTLIDRSRLEELERLQAFAFSAATFEIDDRTFIVFNPLRSRERLRSDVSHELAHLHLEHDLAEIQMIDGVPFRTCRPDQEEQATAWGGALLLPRPLLLRDVSNGLDANAIASKYGVTPEMARFRVNTTGVLKQAQRRRV